MATRVTMSGLIPQGHQQIKANSTAAAINSTVKLSSVLIFSVQTADVRAKWTGGAPTANTGVVFASGQTYVIDGYNGTTALRFIAVSGSPVVDIAGFKQANDV